MALTPPDLACIDGLAQSVSFMEAETLSCSLSSSQLLYRASHQHRKVNVVKRKSRRNGHCCDSHVRGLPGGGVLGPGLTVGFAWGGKERTRQPSKGSGTYRIKEVGRRQGWGQVGIWLKALEAKKGSQPRP